MSRPDDVRSLFAGLPLIEDQSAPEQGQRHPAAAALAAAGAARPSGRPVADAPTPAPEAQPAAGGSRAGDDDASMIEHLADMVVNARQLRADEEAGGNRDAVGQDIIRKALADYQEQRVRAGKDRLTQDETAALQRRLFDLAYRLGPIQKYLDDVTVENIHANGADELIVRRANGIDERVPPIAGSDAELVEMVQSWVQQAGEGSREWTTAEPILRMSLPTPEGERLTAWLPPIATRPAFRIRCHRIRNITLEDLVGLDMLTAEAAELLSAAVRARQSVVTSGHPGAGKTSFTRALAASFDPNEPVVTIETERELYLGEPNHHNVLALQERPGQGERDTRTNEHVGAVSLDDLLASSLRADAQRIIVGEVRSSEVVPMFLAMASAAGSMTTIHADTSQDAIAKLAALQQRELGTSDVFANRQIIDHIRLIVQLSTFTGAGIRRHVTEIAEIQRGEGDRPVAHYLFRSPERGEPAVPVREGRPSDKLAAVLADFGYDVNKLWRAS
ncbi:ATPase, T2SS/T4P/T4SS family [Sinomonas sp. JGH33]|uniref:ATPase, T2SS/T4P/T4SS family n=1 Tax=Sinomonas terricola TaxID=3110330 RepID=A0ABU5TCP1_9MICC|nr:ATPase, T2SS/T4P/T4SS family [Sinomonas sp. JGH33]MEA5457295.1 ATPase, T2SS/T4P/T4SS family [Sinomonas sp. JGH33]